MLSDDATDETGNMIRVLGDRLPTLQTVTIAFADSAVGFRLFLDGDENIVGFRPVELAPDGSFAQIEPDRAWVLGNALGVGGAAFEVMGMRICGTCDPPRALGYDGCRHE